MGIVLITGRPRSTRRGSWLALGIAVAVAVAGCSSGTGPSDDGRLRVVAAFYPLAEAASKVGGDLVDVENLTPPGVEPHDLELAPQQIADIQGADVVLYLGQGFAPAIERAVADADGTAVDLLEGLPEPPTGAELADAHVWLDPVRYGQMVDQVLTALVDSNPAGAAAFERNAVAFSDQLAALDREFGDGLTGCERDLIVTSHAAFGYLAERYGLVQEAIAGLAPDAEPSPERLAELADLVRREGVTTIFTEELVSPKVAETLAREVGVRTAVLNPLEGLTEEEVAAGEDYLSVMRRNLSTLREALGCP